MANIHCTFLSNKCPSTFGLKVRDSSDNDAEVEFILLCEQKFGYTCA